MDPEYPYTPSYTFSTSGNIGLVTYTNFPQWKKAHDGDSYEAVNENPRVFCSHGPTPVDALRAMADILKENGIDTWKASSVHFDEEGTHFLTIYT